MRRRRSDGPQARRQRPPAVLVVSTVAQQQTVEHGCPIAAAAGVRSGISLAHGRALLGKREVKIVPHDPARDAAALAALARWCTRWSPVVRADPPSEVLLDIAGCEHLFGGERGLAKSLGASLRRLGLTPRIGVASTVGAAWAVARFGGEAMAFVQAGVERQAIDGLPVASLRIDTEAIDSLEEVGVQTVGQLLVLPRVTLPARYGPALLQRIDQALGRVPEPVHGVQTDEPLMIALELSGGTTQWESIAEAVRRMLESLTAELRRREAGVSRLEARFTRLDASPAALTVELSRPTRARSHLRQLLWPKLERLHMGSGIERIELHAIRIAPIVHDQRVIAGIGEHDEGRGPDAELAETLEIIASRIGPDRVHRLNRQASHLPERAWTLAPALAGTQAKPIAASPTEPRPSCLLDPPEPVEAMALCPEGPVLRLWWRGEQRTVTASIGPERIGGEWWIAREAARDYFRVQDQHGLWLWLFRDLGTDQWCVHGVWA